MLKRFLSNSGGNVAMMFGVVSTLLLLGVGVAVDLNGMQTTRSNAQNFADAAVLAAASSGETTQAELQKIAEDTVAANNFDGSAYNVTLNLTSEGFVTVNVSSNYNMNIMGIFGNPDSVINASAESLLADSEHIDIALVLDRTGSMKGTKIASLRTAATALVNVLDATGSDNVRVSVIPFAQYVNVGKSRRSAPWIDVPSDFSASDPKTCYMKKDVISKTNCVTTTRPTRTCYNDGVPYTCGGGDKTTCDITYGPEYEKCYKPKWSSEWRGCVGSRNSPWNERARKGTTLIPGLPLISNAGKNKVRCGERILPLTNDMNAVRGRIASLSARGYTYIPSGLIWGWRALNEEQPLTQAKATKDKKASRVLILMTDGANTRSVDGALHTGKNVNDANSVTKNLCQNIKADKIQVYTIAYDFSDAMTLNMLSKCASKPENFFKANNAAALTTAFEDIGASLNKLRLTN